MNNSLHTRAGTKKLWRFAKHIVYETMPFFVSIAVLSVLGGITWAIIYFNILDWAAGFCALVIILSLLAISWKEFDRKDRP